MSKKQKKLVSPQKVYNKRQLNSLIMSMFNEQPRRSLNYKQIASALSVKDDQTRRLISDVLYELVLEERLVEISTGKFKLSELSKPILGRVDLQNDGSAIVHLADGGEVSVASPYLGHALQGDLVELVISRSRKSWNRQAEVARVVERSNRKIVGRIQITPQVIFVVPDNKFMTFDIIIPENEILGARDNQKVIVEIIDWFPEDTNPTGRVVEVIGDPGNNEVEMHAILAEFDLPYRFPPELEQLANALDDGIKPSDLAQRRDFRQVTTFTIDPADAKDFDDALSVQPLQNGNTQVGIHIADVTHYVTPGSPIDEEARLRGTSVYLVDRVVPMLPERLSNFICSLRPDEDKLCFSAVFELDADANVVNQWFGRTVIRSDRRFSYDEAQQIIDTGVGDLQHEILLLNHLAQKLRERRFSQGAIAFERLEVGFKLDASGAPLGVYVKQNLEANQLIEEFMLLANRHVAELVASKKLKKREFPFVYRVHDKPNPEKLDAFRSFVARFGYKLTGNSGPQISKSFNRIISEVRGRREQNIIETLALRSLAKAQYTTENIGHYGLAFAHYTHFTSPIRRYPDMMVHRLLASYLSEAEPVDREELEIQCRYATNREILATEAERASIKYKQVEFLVDKRGQHFMGTISGVTKFGLFVELQDIQCDGMVCMRDLDDDFYIFDEESFALVGRRTGKMYQLGDSVMVEIFRTNLEKKQLDLRIVSKQRGSLPPLRNSDSCTSNPHPHDFETAHKGKHSPGKHTKSSTKGKHKRLK